MRSMRHPLPMKTDSKHILAACILLIASTATQAKDGSRIQTYPVLGKTAADIYAIIKTQSPKIAPNATFAFTQIATKTNKKTRSSKTSCAYASFDTAGFYIFNIPKHAEPNTISRRAKPRWDSFVSYLLTHEEGHRTIWQACLKDYDAQALELSAKTCEKLDAAREKLFTKIKRQCLEQDEKFDFYFRKDVQKQPFMVDALKGK
jgi:predicted secreted Zn-dependent protease